MLLLSPTVVTPLSECSRQVRVQNQLTGSTVRIYADGTQVGHGTATSADQVFDLDPSASLAPGAKVTATQSVGSDDSLHSPLPVTVQKKPPVIGHVTIVSHLYQCGHCLYINGAVPGATVEVRGATNAFRGSAKAPDGVARVTLNAPTGSGEVIHARQQACGAWGLPTNSAPADPIPTPKGERLAAPVVEGPLYECDRRVTVGGVFDGAQVTLTRTAGPTEIGCFDLGKEWFAVPPLVKGETVSATQMYVNCNTVPSVAAAGIIVLPADPVPVPTLVPPLCADGQTVNLTGLRPGALIRIYQNGSELGTAESAGTSATVQVPPLLATAVVVARQAVCGNKWSKDSNAVKVHTQPANLPTPVVVGPLYECGNVVRVVNIHPGAMCYVYSTILAGPIGSALLNGSAADITVAPELILDDSVYAVVAGCGLNASSAKVHVGKLPEVVPLAVRQPISECTTSIIVTGVLPGAIVDVHSDAGWWSSVAASTSVVEVPLGGALHAGDLLSARQRICGHITGFGAAATVQAGLAFVTMQHNDRNRSGANLCETVLGVRTVNRDRFGLVFKRTVDGHMYAQPLYVPGVNIPGQGVHNVIYVATMHNSVYAFDAENPASSAPLWHATLGPSFQIPLDPTNPPSGEVYKYSNFQKEIGIVSTPVIDLASETLWVLAFVDVAGVPLHWLHALDITTGKDRPHSPRRIEATTPGTGGGSVGGVITFNSANQAQRPGLVVANGMIYAAFASFADQNFDTYHGWVLGYDRMTLEQMAVFCTTPNARAGGIWMSGQGPVVDTDGNLYVMTGNSGANTNPPVDGDLGESFIKISPSGDLFDWFTPHDFADLNQGDFDLGSSGPVMVPGTRLLFGGGKGARDRSTIYVLDTSGPSSMGHYNAAADVPPAIQAFVATSTGPGTHHLHGAPVFWWGPAGGIIYLWPENDVPRAYRWLGTSFQTSPVSLGTMTDAAGMPGGILALSAHGSAAGSGIVWATHALGDDATVQAVTGIVRAFDASNLTHELWNSEMNAARDSLGKLAKFCPPTIAHGRVYLSTFSGELHVYGLL